MEDYAKALYALEARSRGPVGTNALAQRLGLTPGSVSAMLRKLDELGLIVLMPYRGVQLTEEGRRLALEVMRHHRLIELFLAEQLGTAHWFDQRATRAALGWAPAVGLDEGFRRVAAHYGGTGPEA